MKTYSTEYERLLNLDENEVNQEFGDFYRYWKCIVDIATNAILKPKDIYGAPKKDKN